MQISKDKIREIITEEVENFVKLSEQPNSELETPAKPKQKSDVTRATDKMQAVSSLQTYIEKIDNPVELQQFLGNVVEMASQKIPKAQVLAALTKLTSVLRKES